MIYSVPLSHLTLSCHVLEPQPEPHLDKPAKRVPEKLSKLVMEKTAKPAPERPPKTPGKPASPDSFNKMGSEKVTKSPPPPPPRKTFGNSGMTTTRSGEVVYTSRKDSQVSLVKKK